MEPWMISELEKMRKEQGAAKEVRIQLEIPEYIPESKPEEKDSEYSVIVINLFQE